MTIGGPRGRDDVLKIIEKRILRHTQTRRECIERGEPGDAEFLRGCVSELEAIRAVVEAMPAPEKVNR